jgi:glutathione synthase/RimK-type ligase-like ATP-grasp enzyme
MATLLKKRPVSLAGRLVLVPQNFGSRSAKALAEVLSEKLGKMVYRVRPDNLKGRIAFQFREGTDKLTQFRRFHENNVSCPEFTTDTSVARGWAGEGAVVCRTLLRGSEGRGIVVAEAPDQIVAAPLYTRYTKKRKEFRVHVFNGEVIDVQEKRKRQDHDGDRDTRIRNTANGYVFCRENVVEPEGLRALALSAVQALGYNMGAVDVGWNERDNRCFVLEVNSTPGMEGTTLQKYADAIINWYRSQPNALRVLR